MTTPTAVVPARNVVSPGAHAMTRAGQWSQREAQLVADVITKGLTPVELSAFAAVCRHTQLDPFRRQIYAIKRGGVMNVQVAIDGYRSLAARSGDYMGQIGPEWCGPDGVWRDVWLDETAVPAAARVGVRRRGWEEPVFATVTSREFKQDTATWKSMPAHMLAVRAESHALRRAFPETFAAFESIATGQGANIVVEAVDEAEIPQIEAPANAGEGPAETNEEDVRSDQTPSPAELELNAQGEAQKTNGR